MGARPSRSRATSPSSSPYASPSRPARRLSVPNQSPPNQPPVNPLSASPQIKRATDAAQAYAQSHMSHLQSHEWEIYPPQLEGQYQPMTIAEDDEEIFQRINVHLEKIPFLPAIESRTGISKLNLVFFFAFLSLLLIAHIAGASSIVNFVAFVYPAYMSYKTLQSDDVIMHRHWLIYWVVYGLFHVCEVVGDVTLYWLPYYYPLKILFLVWCFHPHYRGCSIMYEYGMRPFLIEHQLTIDDIMEYIQTTTTRAIVEIRQVTTELVMQIAVNVIRTITGREQLSRPPPARDGVGQWMDSPPSPSPASGRMSPLPQQHVSPLIRQRSVSPRPHVE